MSSCEDEVILISKKLSKSLKETDTSDDNLLDMLKVLEKQPITLEILQRTRIGKTVNSLRKASKNDEIVTMSKALVKTWKKLLEGKGGPGPKNGSTYGGDEATGKSSNGAAANGEIDESSMQSIDSSHASHSQSSAPGGSNEGESADVTASRGEDSGSEDRLKDNNSDTEPPVSSDPTTNVGHPTFSHTRVTDTRDEVRLKCRQMIVNSLLAGEVPAGTHDPEVLAGRIEDCIFDAHRSVSEKYKACIRSRVFNLRDKKNTDLRVNVLLGAIAPKKLSSMTSEEMASNEMKGLRDKFTKEAIEEHQMAIDEGTPTELFKCGKCRGKNCTYTQAQTRSADEPMTTFVLCMQCGNRWKFC